MDELLENPGLEPVYDGPESHPTLEDDHTTLDNGGYTAEDLSEDHWTW